MRALSSRHDSSLWNEDLAPVPSNSRTWTRWHFAALWVGMCICIPSYMLAASLMKEGMYWWQALLTITLGNLIVLVPMLLNAHAGAKYGIPFPVLLRSSFGVTGANIPAVMRALVGCGWFGIQTWIGATALHGLAAIAMRRLGVSIPIEPLAAAGITWLELVCFLAFWAVNMWVVVRGIECIKWLEVWAAPLLLVTGLALLVWGVSAAGGFGVIFAEHSVAEVRGNIARGSVENFNFWKVFFPQLTAMVGFWATLSLNIPDFTRFAKSQREQIIGQAISLPTTMALFSFIGISVTASTVVLYGHALWDPVQVVARFENPLPAVLGLAALLIATLSTNIAANVVSPANDFSNLRPNLISFRSGGVITGVIGILIMPWRLVADLGAYVFTWLIGYGAMLGAIGGVMLADYYIVRRRQLAVEDLFRRDGIYAYGGSGINWRAVSAMALGILPNVPGFLQAASNGGIQVPPVFSQIYTYAWFIALFVSGIMYVLLMKTIKPAERR